MLTGFSIERVDAVIGENLYRLRSMYAESAEDYLLFQVCVLIDAVSVS
jgi:hypothetical protein